jgi:hypothetical protein
LFWIGFALCSHVASFSSGKYRVSCSQQGILWGIVFPWTAPVDGHTAPLRHFFFVLEGGSVVRLVGFRKEQDLPKNL